MRAFAPLTDDELAEIRARADKATPGPWTPQSVCSNRSAPGGVEPWESKETAGLGFDIEGPPHPILDRYRFENGWDAVFIAHARDDVPRLLAEIKQLRQENDALYDQLASEGLV